MKIFKKIGVLALLISLLSSTISVVYAEPVDLFNIVSEDKDKLYIESISKGEGKDLIYSINKDFSGFFHLLNDKEFNDLKEKYRYADIKTLRRSYCHSIDLKLLKEGEDFEIRDDFLWDIKENIRILDLKKYIKENEEYYLSCEKEKAEDKKKGLENKEYLCDSAEKLGARDIKAYVSSIDLKSGKKVYMITIYTKRVIPPPYTPQYHKISVLEKGLVKELDTIEGFIPAGIYENENGSFWLNGFIRLNKWEGYQACYLAKNHGKTILINDIVNKKEKFKGSPLNMKNCDILGVYQGKAVINSYYYNEQLDDFKSRVYEIDENLKLKLRNEKMTYKLSQIDSFVSQNGELYSLTGSQDEPIVNLTRGNRKLLNGNSSHTVMFTDIKTYINNMPIDTVNVNGYTAVKLKDLDGKGFTVTYDNNSRTQTVVTEKDAQISNNDFSKPKYIGLDIGQPLGYIAKSDIKVIFDGKELQGYNLDGYMLVIVQDLKKVGMDIKYDEEKREVFIDDMKNRE